MALCPRMDGPYLASPKPLSADVALPSAGVVASHIRTPSDHLLDAAVMVGSGRVDVRSKSRSHSRPMKRASCRFCCHRVTLRATLVHSAARTGKVRSLAPAYSTNVVVTLFRRPVALNDSNTRPCFVASRRHASDACARERPESLIHSSSVRCQCSVSSNGTD